MDVTFNRAGSLQHMLDSALNVTDKHCPDTIKRNVTDIMRSLTIMPYVRTPGFSPFEERTLPKRISFDGG